tara:strand:+ start:355 stop:867 length:513 start_codon:yes stop_codon:yes gene_type:complete
MKKLRKVILDLFLSLIFKTKTYVYPYVQSAVKLQLIISIGDKFVIFEDTDRFKMPSVEVDLQKKHSIVFTVKKFLKYNVSKKINSNNFFKLHFLDYCREQVSTNKEQHLIVDDLYIKLNLTDQITNEDLLEGVKLLSLDEIKLLQFKNKFNIYDYKVIINSLTEEGIDIK